MNVTFDGQSDFADVMKLRIWRWEGCPDNFSVNIRVLIREKCQKRKRFEDTMLLALQVKERVMSQGT